MEVNKLDCREENVTNVMELTYLSEIQKFLPDGHVDKVKPKSERYTATMLYFNQLREPERSQAIANYDENYDSQIVGELFTALNSGFSWTSSPEGDYYWQDISDRIEDGSYFKEELLNYREVVHCSTQEEFDFVLSKFNPKNINNIHWNEYKEDTCLNILDLSNPTNEGFYCYKPYYLNRKYNILTFKQWCEKYNHSYESTITIPNEWTANNWYVKVNSQEEANEIIEIAARMYGYDDLIDSYSYINGSWEYVTLRHCNPAYCIQSMEYIKDKKERPISDFIGIVTPTNNIISMVSSIVQYLSTLKPLDLVNTFSGVLSEEDFERLKSPYGKNPLTPSESHLPNLITKSKSNLLDTKVNTIKSISINLQQKPKTIKL
jgi:hypothetical protein